MRIIRVQFWPWGLRPCCLLLQKMVLFGGGEVEGGSPLALGGSLFPTSKEKGGWIHVFISVMYEPAFVLISLPVFPEVSRSSRPPSVNSTSSCSSASLSTVISTLPPFKVVQKYHAVADNNGLFYMVTGSFFFFCACAFFFLLTYLFYFIPAIFNSKWNCKKEITFSGIVF